MSHEPSTDSAHVAKGTRYALTGGRARRDFRVGNLYINRCCTGAIVERHPFGGFKMSGVGFRSCGPDYLLQFTVPGVVTENTMRRGCASAEDGDE